MTSFRPWSRSWHDAHVSLAEEKGARLGQPEERLFELIDEQVSEDRAPVVRGFARAYLRRLGSGGTDGISAEDLLAEVLALFDFACARDGEPIAVRAFNPTREEFGYEPAGSVVETNTDDLPFLVDSVSGELEARGLQVVRLRHPIMATERAGDGRIRAVRDPRGAVHRESVMHFDLDRRLSDEELAELEQAVRGVLASRPRGRARLPRDGRARARDGAARARGRLPLPGRRGRGGRRLPRLAAAGRVRLPAAPASTTSPRAACRSSPARGWGSSPTRRSPRSPSACRSASCPTTCAAARSRATCCWSTSPTRRRPCTGASGWTTSASGAWTTTARSPACRA